MFDDQCINDRCYLWNHERLKHFVFDGYEDSIWKLFLTLFGESGFNSSWEGDRDRTRQQEGRMKEKNKGQSISVRLEVSIYILALGSNKHTYHVAHNKCVLWFMWRFIEFWLNNTSVLTKTLLCLCTLFLSFKMSTMKCWNYWNNLYCGLSCNKKYSNTK